MKASSCIGENDVRPSLARPMDGIEDHGTRVGSVFPADDFNFNTLSPDLELLDGCCTEGVSRRKNHLLALGF